MLPSSAPVMKRRRSRSKPEDGGDAGRRSVPRRASRRGGRARRSAQHPHDQARNQGIARARRCQGNVLSRMREEASGLDVAIAAAESAIASLQGELHRQEKAVVGYDLQVTPRATRPNGSRASRSRSRSSGGAPRRSCARRSSAKRKRASRSSGSRPSSARRTSSCRRRSASCSRRARRRTTRRA